MYEQKNELTKVEIPERFSTVKLDVDGFRLTLRDREIALLMTTRSTTKMTVDDIAEMYGVSRQMIYKLAKQEEFKKFQAYILEEIYSELFGKAVQELHDILDNSKSHSVKLKAVQLVFQSTGRLKQEHEIEVKQPKDLNQLEREVLEMERELLEDGDY